MGREELSKDGKRLWDSIGKEENEHKYLPAKPTRKKKVVEGETVAHKLAELKRIENELKKIIRNSQIVRANAQEIMDFQIKKEEYFKANEAKVALVLHLNLITRLQRVLDGASAFDHEVIISEEF